MTNEVPFLRYVDVPDQQRLKSFIEESAQASSPPRRLFRPGFHTFSMCFNGR